MNRHAWFDCYRTEEAMYYNKKTENISMYFAEEVLVFTITGKRSVNYKKKVTPSIARKWASRTGPTDPCV